MPRASRVGPGDSQARRLAGTDTVHHPGRIGQRLAYHRPSRVGPRGDALLSGPQKERRGRADPGEWEQGGGSHTEEGVSKARGRRRCGASRPGNGEPDGFARKAAAGAPTSPDASNDGRDQEPRHATRPGASGNAVGPDEAGRNSRPRQRAGRDVGPRGSPRSWSVRNSDPREPASSGLWEIPHARDTWPRAVSILSGANPSPTPQGLPSDGVCDARHPPRDTALASVSCERQRERRSSSPKSDIRPLSAGERRGATAP